MYREFGKRLSDLLLSLVFLSVLWPLLLALCLTGAAAMRGNPFFTQERVGRDERIFRMVKFRSMNDRRGPDGRLLPDEERLTRYGRFLRKTSLDELPELFHILRGEMSFVGPRPLLPEYLPFYTRRERRRHSVRPGLTGLAQIHGRNDIASWEERFDYDLAYVENCSLRGDVRILLATARQALRGTGVLCGSEIRAGRLDDARRQENDDRHCQTLP